MSENAPQEELEQTNSVPAGVLLREARLATKLSIEEVASELHLSVDIVDALEKGDKEKLPSRVFTLGYLKNYAKLVNVPFEQARAAFDDMAEEEIPVLNQPRAPSLSTQSRKSSGGTAGWLLKSFVWFLILGGLLLAAFLWWKGDLKIPGLGNDFPFRAGKTPVEESAQTQPVEAPGDASGTLSVTLDPETNQQLLVPLQSGDEVTAATTEEIATDAGESPATAEAAARESAPPAVEAESTVDVSEPSTETDELTIALESPAVETPAADSAPEAIEIPVVVQQESPSSPLSTLASIMPAAEPAESAAAPEETADAVAAADQSGIQIDFSGRCWVQVTDGNGKVILSGEMQAGDSKAIDGASPLRFVLGNAKVVRMTVGNEQFDLDPHTSGNVARFTLQATEG